MANKKKIKALYDELSGYLAQAPLLDSKDPLQSIYDEAIWSQFNETANLVCNVTGRDYSRFYIKPITDEILPCIRVMTYRQKLNGLISTLKVEYFDKDLGSSGKKATLKSKAKTYIPWDILHPNIEKRAKSRFESDHFADSVEAAYKEINIRVKQIVKKQTGKEFDGSDLMNRAFSLQNPIITLADISSLTGENIQKGYMQIFSGAMTGIRNPKAHENLEIDAKRAIHLLYLASLLMYKIDERI